MEVTNPRCTFLTNREVLNILQNAKSAKSRDRAHRSHNTVLYETIKYLRSTAAASQTETEVHKCSVALAKFGLTGTELLQIANHRPKSSVEIGVLIEECDERFSEEKIAEMLKIVAETLSETPPAVLPDSAESSEET